MSIPEYEQQEIDFLNSQFKKMQQNRSEFDSIQKQRKMINDDHDQDQILNFEIPLFDNDFFENKHAPQDKVFSILDLSKKQINFEASQKFDNFDYIQQKKANLDFLFEDNQQKYFNDLNSNQKNKSNNYSKENNFLPINNFDFSASKEYKDRFNEPVFDGFCIGGNKDKKIAIDQEKIKQIQQQLDISQDFFDLNYNHNLQDKQFDSNKKSFDKFGGFFMGGNKQKKIQIDDQKIQQMKQIFDDSFQSDELIFQKPSKSFKQTSNDQQNELEQNMNSQQSFEGFCIAGNKKKIKPLSQNIQKMQNLFQFSQEFQDQNKNFNCSIQSNQDTSEKNNHQKIKDQQTNNKITKKIQSKNTLNYYQKSAIKSINNSNKKTQFFIQFDIQEKQNQNAKDSQNLIQRVQNGWQCQKFEKSAINKLTDFVPKQKNNLDCILHKNAIDYYKIHYDNSIIEKIQISFNNNFFSIFDDEEFDLENHVRYVIQKLYYLENKFNFKNKELNFRTIEQELQYRFIRNQILDQKSILQQLNLQLIDPKVGMILFIQDITEANDRQIIELSDGWSSIKVLNTDDQDQSYGQKNNRYIKKLITNKKLVVGQKIIIHNMVQHFLKLNDQQIYYKIYYNSLRRAKWHEKLGLCKNIHPRCLKSIRSNGGTVPCIDIIVIKLFNLIKFQDQKDQIFDYHQEDNESQFKLQITFQAQDFLNYYHQVENDFNYFIEINNISYSFYEQIQEGDRLRIYNLRVFESRDLTYSKAIYLKQTQQQIQLININLNKDQQIFSKQSRIDNLYWSHQIQNFSQKFWQNYSQKRQLFNLLIIVDQSSKKMIKGRDCKNKTIYLKVIKLFRYMILIFSNRILIVWKNKRFLFLYSIMWIQDLKIFNFKPMNIQIFYNRSKNTSTLNRLKVLNMIRLIWNLKRKIKSNLNKQILKKLCNIFFFYSFILKYFLNLLYSFFLQDSLLSYQQYLLVSIQKLVLHYLSQVLKFQKFLYSISQINHLLIPRELYVCHYYPTYFQIQPIQHFNRHYLKSFIAMIVYY